MTTSTNPLKIRSIHHVELWVGNAKQSAFYYRNASRIHPIRVRRPRDREPQRYQLRA